MGSDTNLVLVSRKLRRLQQSRTAPGTRGSASHERNVSVAAVLTCRFRGCAGEWFKDVQEETEAAGAAAPNRTPLGGLTGWLTGSKPAAEEAAEDPAERQSLLPSFLGGGKPAAPTPPPETDWTCGLSR